VFSGLCPLQSVSPFGVVPDCIEVEFAWADAKVFPPTHSALVELACLSEFAR
jgi:hypothetical protein